MRTFNYFEIETNELIATDLEREARTASDPHAYCITIYDNGRPLTGSAEALYADGRLGIAWGADATWADVPGVERGIEMWLNDPEAWKAAS
jgi:hypothetical protein